MRLLETKAFDHHPGQGAASSAAEQREIQQWLEGQHPGRVVAVLPASRVICRACPLPKGTPERLQTALDLQAEAHLLGAVPRHRLATAVLPAATGEPGRTGLLIGWPEGAASTPSPLATALGAGSTAFDLAWTADVVALAALLAAQRPEEPLLWMNRDDGSVAIALCGRPSVGDAAPGVLTFRATREESASDDEWRADVRRVVAETALSIDLPASSVRAILPTIESRLAQAPNSALLIPDAVRDATRSAVAGVPADSQWWNDFGVALGAAMGASGELAALSRLRESPNRERPTILARTAAGLAKPRTAALLGILAAVMIAVGPLAFARVRLGLLESKVTDLDELRRSNAEDMQLRAMYRELGSQSWPIAKLAGDIANCTPEGIELTSIDISRSQGIALMGIAKPAKDKTGKEEPAGKRVEEMARLMDASGLFDSLTTKSEPGPIASTSKVTITAKVRDAFRPVDWKPDDDFAVTSMAERRYPTKPSVGMASSARASGRASEAVPDHEGGDDVRAASDGGADRGPDGVVEAGGSLARASEDDGGDGPAPSDDGSGVGSASTGSDTAAGRGSGRRAASAADDTARGGRKAAASDAGSATERNASAASGEKDGAAAAAEGAAAEGATDEGGAGNGGPARRSAGDSGSSGGAATRGGRSGPVGSVVPDPLTEVEINAMSSAELTQALVRIAEARNSMSVNTETKERLKNEFNLILKRQREMKK